MILLVWWLVAALVVACVFKLLHLSMQGDEWDALEHRTFTPRAERRDVTLLPGIFDWSREES